MRLILPNPSNSYIPFQVVPRIAESAYVLPGTAITGAVTVADQVYIGFGTVVRGDWGAIYVGPRCNLQDHVVIHHKPHEGEDPLAYGVHLDREVSVLHGACVHGPSHIGRNTFIGQLANLFDAHVGADCVVLHGATLTGGVKVPDGRLVGAGQVVDTQAAADALPPVPEAMRSLNPRVVKGYMELGEGYAAMLAARSISPVANKVRI